MMKMKTTPPKRGATHLAPDSSRVKRGATHPPGLRSYPPSPSNRLLRSKGEGVFIIRGTFARKESFMGILITKCLRCLGSMSIEVLSEHEAESMAGWLVCPQCAFHVQPQATLFNYYE
ncbi:MAG: hypothetical protein JWQ04_2965 [Pedosphaera sp.]|nr:hypothetical protein [Pedosphaera sp.]